MSGNLRGHAMATLFVRPGTHSPDKAAELNAVAAAEEEPPAEADRGASAWVDERASETASPTAV